MTSILHVWDQSGVSCVLAKYQNKLGHKSLVIKRQNFDPFKIMSFYKQRTVKTFFGRPLIKIAIKKAKNFEIIHLHDLFEFIPELKKKYPEKKIVLHYHGTKLRNTPKQKRKDFEKNADMILVSTLDLLSFVNGYYLPIPVDVEHFSPRTIPANNLALGFIITTESEERFAKILKDHNLKVNLKTVTRKKDPVLYKEMPDFLSDFEYYLDHKLIYGTKPGPFLSTTGLQALALGMKVINYEYEIIKGLPREHHPDKVVETLNGIYEKIID